LLQVEFQNRDWVEASFLVVLNVSHVEEFSSHDDSSGYPFKQGLRRSRTSNRSIARRSPVKVNRTTRGVMKAFCIAFSAPR